MDIHGFHVHSYLLTLLIILALLLLKGFWERIRADRIAREADEWQREWGVPGPEEGSRCGCCPKKAIKKGPEGP